MREMQNDDQNPYTAPVDAAPQSESLADPKWRRIRTVAIVIIVLSCLIGVAVPIIAMTMSFDAASQENPSPTELATNISSMTKILPFAPPMLLFGVVLLIVAALKLRRRPIP